VKNKNQVKRHSGFRWHLIGAAGLVWSLITWIEWFVIPFLFPNRHGPVPYLDFAPQTCFLLFGCTIFSVVIFFLPLSWKMRILYLSGPVSFLAYQSWRVV
jgi:hypothetical protein